MAGASDRNDVKSLWNAVAYPRIRDTRRITQGSAEECGRSTAWRANKRRICRWCIVLRMAGGRCGASTAMPDGQWRKPAKIAAFFRFFVLGKVDRNRERTLYRSSWVRRRLGALARPRSPSLFYTVTEHPAMLVAMFASPRRIRGGSGCLTSESEERETWTAESLRAACRVGESFA